jgi:hypothetical protein
LAISARFLVVSARFLAVGARLLAISARFLAVGAGFLVVGARLLAISVFGHRLEIFRHRLDRASEFGQLGGDTGDVLSVRHVLPDSTPRAERRALLVKPRGNVGVLHVRCSRCGGRLRAGSYVLPVGVNTPLQALLED